MANSAHSPFTHGPVTHGKLRAPRGPALTCKGWRQEAALRLLMNSLDPEVAERPEELVVHATQRAAADWESYEAIVAALCALEAGQMLVVQSGKPAGTISTRADAPSVVNQGDTASWLYAGTQSALHTAYLVFGVAARKHFGGTLAGRLVVSGGMGGAGGAQALAAAWQGAAFLGIDADAEHIKRRLKSGYCDVLVNSLDEAMRMLKNAVRKREPVAVGLEGNCAEVLPTLAERGIVPDLLTDQTPARDPLAYLPRGVDPAAAAALLQREPDEYRRRALDSIAAHARAMLDLQKLGSVVFEFGNGLRAAAIEAGVGEAAQMANAQTEFLDPLLREGREPLLWVALSGEPSDMRRLDDALLQEFAADESLAQWLRLMKRRGRFEGLPARVCWLSGPQRARLAEIANDLVARGELKAPVALARDLDFAAAAALLALGDRTAVSAVVDAMASTFPGASLIELPNSGHAEIAPRAGSMLIADGTPEAAARIERLLSIAPRPSASEQRSI